MTLLPCPFCGGEADIEEISGNPFTNEPYTWAVGCKDCNVGWYKETKEDAIAAWNRRVQPELIRCEKCDYWDKSASYMSAHACAFWSSGKKTRYTENHEFCSFAERKEE